MRKHAMAACLLMATLGVCARRMRKHSLRGDKPAGSRNYLYRATGTTPVAFTNVSKEQL